MVIPIGNAAGASLVTDATPQLSAVTGVPSTTLVDVHATLVVPEVAAGAVIVGFCVSFTVTVKLDVVVLPAASVALYVTVVVPTGKVDPLTGPAVCAMLLPVQLSAAVGAVHVTTAPHTPSSFDLMMLAGKATMVGFCVSFTVTVKLDVVVLPAASVAL